MNNAPKFRNKDGSLSVYAFACGYVESFTLDGKDYYASDAPGVALYKDGIWHVRAHSRPFGHPDNVWNSFETLTEARAAFRHYKQQIQSGQDVVEL